MTTTLTNDVLHPEDVLFFHEVATACWKVAKTYRLPLRGVFPKPIEMDSKDKGRYGHCLPGDGTIHIVFRPKEDGEWCEAPLSPEEIWDTAAHELAHLRHVQHNVAFAEFHQELLGAMRNEKKDHRQSVIDKVVKLQQHRDSAAKIGSSAEAEAFAGMINKLLVSHEINASELDYARASDDDPVIEVGLNRDLYKMKKKNARVAWEEELASVVANAHLCRILVVPGSNRVIFVGTRSHALVAEYAYGTLAPLAAKLSVQEYDRFWLQLKAQHGHARGAAGFRGSWLDAFVGRIREKFEESKKATIAEEAARTGGTSSETALLRLNGSLVKVRKYIDEKFAKRSSSGASYLHGRNLPGNAEGSKRGRAAADSMMTRKAVGSSSRRKALGDGK